MLKLFTYARENQFAIPACNVTSSRFVPSSVPKPQHCPACRAHLVLGRKQGQTTSRGAQTPPKEDKLAGSANLRAADSTNHIRRIQSNQGQVLAETC